MTTLTYILNLIFIKDLTDIIIGYTQLQSYKRINKIRYHRSEYIKSGFIISSYDNDTVILDKKNHIIHGTLIPEKFTASIFIIDSSACIFDNYGLHHNSHIIRSRIIFRDRYTRNPIKITCKDVGITDEFSVFLGLEHFYVKTRCSHSIYPHLLHQTYDHLFIIRNKNEIALINENPKRNESEIIFFSLDLLKFKTTDAKLLKVNKNYYLDDDQIVEMNFYFAVNKNTSDYLGSKIWFVFESKDGEKRYSAIYMANGKTNNLYVMREREYEIYEQVNLYE